MGMTFDERVNAVSEFGFTTRQARFLVTVMLHGGMCVPRQFARFAGIAYGHKVNVFFDKLVSLHYAVRCCCVHNRAAVYHVRHAALYRAIGEPHHRNRKPIAAASVVDRLMLLDAVISHHELQWLATVSDKIDFFTAAASLDAQWWPKQTVGGTLRYFPDHLPIAVTHAAQIVLLFLATSSRTDGLKAFLQRHAEILRALPTWTIRLVLPPHVARMQASIERIVREELAKTQSVRIGGIECEVLPLSYRRLSPLTSLVCPRVKGVEEGEHIGERSPALPQPPRVERADDDSAANAHDWRRVADDH
jgi:hypothetical protein